jgi:hypothetical protein
MVPLSLIASTLCAQVVGNLGFAALPRPINHATPLAPATSVAASRLLKTTK